MAPMASSEHPFPRLAGLSRVAGIGLVLASVAGCGLIGSKQPQYDCPTTAAVGDATVQSKFRPGPGRDLTDVRYQVRLADVSSECRYDSKGVEVRIKAGFALELGPANPDRKAVYEFFVAITDPNDEIVAKRNFTTPLEFPANVGYLEHLEELQPRIPLPKGGSAADYKVILGLQLTEDELDYNRKYEKR